VSTKFLGLQIDNHINWETNIEEMIPKLSRTCYAIRSLVHVSNINTLQTIYYAYFHSIIKCGIIFWGNSSTVGRFSLHKRKSSELWVVHNQELHVEVCLNRDFACSMPLYAFVNELHINDHEIFQTNSSVQNIDTRHKHHLHGQNASLFCIQKSTFYAGIKMFNNLPPSVTILKNDKAKFKATLRKYLHTHSFYCVYEFFYM